MIKNHMFGLLERNDVRLMQNSSNSRPDVLMMNKLKDILTSSTTVGSTNYTKNLAFERDCKRKLENDISVIVVSIDSPTFTKTKKISKGTIFDKLAYIGNI